MSMIWLSSLRLEPNSRALWLRQWTVGCNANRKCVQQLSNYQLLRTSSMLEDCSPISCGNKSLIVNRQETFQILISRQILHKEVNHWERFSPRASLFHLVKAIGSWFGRRGVDILCVNKYPHSKHRCNKQSYKGAFTDCFRCLMCSWCTH
jgi:hypothetical protein